MLYRVFTENTNSEKIKDIVSRYFDGYTVLYGEGCFRLEKENAIIIEIVCERQDKRITRMAQDIKTHNKQGSVLIQRMQNNQWKI